MGGMERKYKITEKTDAFIANRDIVFSGKTYITLEDNLTLKEAREKLLGMYNEKYAEERGYCKNWGLAVIQSRKYVHRANTVGNIRWFEYDSRFYRIEEMEEEEEIIGVAESPLKTFPRVNEFEAGSSYRR